MELYSRFTVLWAKWGSQLHTPTEHDAGIIFTTVKTNNTPDAITTYTAQILPLQNTYNRNQCTNVTPQKHRSKHSYSTGIQTTTLQHIFSTDSNFLVNIQSVLYYRVDIHNPCSRNVSLFGAILITLSAPVPTGSLLVLRWYTLMLRWYFCFVLLGHFVGLFNRPHLRFVEAVGAQKYVRSSHSQLQPGMTRTCTQVLFLSQSQKSPMFSAILGGTR